MKSERHNPECGRVEAWKAEGGRRKPPGAKSSLLLRVSEEMGPQHYSCKKLNLEKPGSGFIFRAS